MNSDEIASTQVEARLVGSPVRTNLWPAPTALGGGLPPTALVAGIVDPGFQHRVGLYPAFNIRLFLLLRPIVY